MKRKLYCGRLFRHLVKAFTFFVRNMSLNVKSTH